MPLLASAAPYADYVIDVRTGEVLHEQNANTRLHPASLTKMMTLYIAFEAIERGEISLDSKVTVSKHAASMPPSKLGLKPGQTIALRYLIRAAAIKSANDAATAIGEAIEGSEPAFAKRMNRTAKALGMSNSTFVNANGLTAAGHLSTAHDMSILGRHLFYDYPQYYSLFSRTSADAGVAQVASTNRRFLSSYKGADGIKTGYTSAAGFNLVASAQRGNKRIIATVFGAKSTAGRNARAAELLDYGFGKAPNRATTQKPSRPAYIAPDTTLMAEADTGDEAFDDSVAEAVARAVTTNSDSVPAGKTIRLNVAINVSPRPKSRAMPGATPETAPAQAAAPEAVLLAMQDDIDAALAEAQNLQLTDEAVAEGETETAVAPALGGSTPQPETVAALGTPAADSFATATAIAPASSLKPIAAPRAAEPQIEIAVATPDDDTIQPVARPQRVAEATTAAAPQTAPDSALAEADVPASTGVEDTIVVAEADTAEPAATTAPVLLAAVSTPAPAPAARPAPIVLTAADPGDEAVASDALEVVTRVSTSGGRQWSVNVGHFGSRYDAERQLLQIALVETNTLGDAQPKVISRKGGFDANFIGLTEEMADLACRRLDARQNDCQVVGP